MKHARDSELLRFRPKRNEPVQLTYVPLVRNRPIYLYIVQLPRLLLRLGCGRGKKKTTENVYRDFRDRCIDQSLNEDNCNSESQRRVSTNKFLLTYDIRLQSQYAIHERQQGSRRPMTAREKTTGLQVQNQK